MLSAEKLFAEGQQSLVGITPPEMVDLLAPKLQYELGLASVADRIGAGDTLRVKLGIDPTGPDIHIGHVVPVRVLDIFARAGQQIDLIFGDFTAKIGDPSGRSTGRQTITDQDIAANVATYRDQVRNYFDTTGENVKVHRNSTWLGRLTLREAFEYLEMTNLSEAMQREDFRSRMAQGGSVSLSEAMYGTLQGIDSFALNSDVEIGGIDQLLNVQKARDVQRRKGQRPQDILLTPIIEGTDGTGRKMSKSYGNYVAALAPPNDIFGSIMSIPDKLIQPYATAFAPIRASEMQGLLEYIAREPLEAKKQLAMYVVALSTGNMHEGLEAREHFERVFSRREVQERDMSPLSVMPETTIMDALFGTGQFVSRSEIRRIAVGKGVRLDGRTIDDDDLYGTINDGASISVGKRKHFKVTHAT